MVATGPRMLTFVTTTGRFAETASDPATNTAPVLFRALCRRNCI
ncbi:protein of unknown function [Acidithiobacillus ferrivorans]|nr:protein of unknown function [Acidithiobacillus ferrivorans]